MTIFAQTLTNPGAETGNTTGWTLRSGVTQTAISSQHHTGSWSFSNANSFADTSKWDQQIAVGAGLFAAIDAGIAGVHGQCWLFAPAEDTGSLYVECYDSGMVLLGAFALPQTLANDWTQQDKYAFIPANTRNIRIGAEVDKNQGTVFNVYWDDFVLEISDSAQVDWPGQLAPHAYQVATYALAASETSTGLFQVTASQIAVYGWVSEPAEQLRALQMPVYVQAASETSSGLFQVKASQVAVYAWVKGYVEKPHVRAWGYSLDGHDHYVLRLGVLGTIVLDLTTGQWADWSGHNLPYWRAHTGINWLGMGKTTADRLYGTNIVAGDDRAGVLWMLDPTKGVDDAPTDDGADQPYTRAATGAVPMTMRQTQRDGGIYLTISLGQPVVTGAAITLRISDDWGKSYRDAGSVTVDPSNYTQELAWRGQGLIRAPGRLYEFTDQGAAVRISYAERK